MSFAGSCFRLDAVGADLHPQGLAKVLLVFAARLMESLNSSL